MSFLSISLTLFLIMNSVGSINEYLRLVNEIKPWHRQRIMIREMIIALLMMFFFHYFGELLFSALDLQPSTVRIAGGIILFLIAIKMVFPKDGKHVPLEREEPFIVPIATPMIAGPSALATIMLYATEEESSLKVLLAITVAWSASVIIFACASLLEKALGDKALVAIERLMGLILTLTAMEMLLKGLRWFFTAA